MDIHMNGYTDDKPLTNFVGLKDGGVAAVTKFKGSSVIQVVISESDEEVAYELKRTISIAFSEMNRKGGISARYNIGDKEVDSIIARHTI